MKKEKEEPRNEIADAIRYAARHLGTDDAATPMGALEAHASLMADAINSHAATLSRSFEEIAAAIRVHAEAVGDLVNALDPSRLQPSMEEPEVEIEGTDPFIVTQGDKVLCRDCFKRKFFEPHPSTWSCSALKYGECSYCGLEIEQPKTMDDWKCEVAEVERDLTKTMDDWKCEVAEVERDLNTGKEKTDE